VLIARLLLPTTAVTTRHTEFTELTRNWSCNSPATVGRHQCPL